ncbi:MULTISPECIES: hypothetical protein [Pacificimonas]|uniref:Uncharacterized protein n=1 Tax=Pacificimonas aurantium TaxID=1250540 RepID=A0ABS7WHQ3_9SPHN|nr:MULTISPECIES: hypothetical protein [Pacificimonas]MBZ6377107.1 hypothetical protein [Pacificimonas aurantium]
MGDLALLDTAAGDACLDYVELYDGLQQRRHLGQVKLEKLVDRGPGWFSAVHFDESLRAFARQVDEPCVILCAVTICAIGADGGQSALW